MKNNNIKTINSAEHHYPAYLREIASSPPVLYYRGSLDYRPEKALAIVGPRKLSPYALSVTKQIAKQLTKNGLAIISGLAYGVDRAAHEACLEAGGKTIAVLGSGLDRESLYPRNHYLLVQKIIEKGGAAISEFEPGTKPRKEFFPRRNRIISGLSRGVLVIEAGEKSGALITARFATDQNRDVFAIPGNITNQSSVGTNKLIQQGAKLVLEAKDILEEWGMEKYREKKEEGLSPEEKNIYQLIQEATPTLDKLAKTSNLSTTKLLIILSEMEIEGKIKKLNGKYYIL